jgi:mannose-1-phosphate guanylyltransferase/mannose-6-phosphate isomerase
MVNVFRGDAGQEGSTGDGATKLTQPAPQAGRLSIVRVILAGSSGTRLWNALDKDDTGNVARIEAGHSPQADEHRKVRCPWGFYDSIAHGDRFQVKRIVVDPGSMLSLQLHHPRAEHWVVVRGTAMVTRGEERFLLGENESTCIPLGVWHRLENPGKVPLEIIEVQSGSYLGEDDIVRFDDTYGRCN